MSVHVWEFRTAVFYCKKLRCFTTSVGHNSSVSNMSPRLLRDPLIRVQGHLKPRGAKTEISLSWCSMSTINCGDGFRKKSKLFVVCIYFSLTSALDGSGWSAPRPGRFIPELTRYPLYRRLGRPQGRSGRVLKISPPPGFDPRTVQLVASRYTD